MTPQTRETFWVKVAVGSNDACWPYLGHINANGYGRVSYKSKLWSAHRLAWFFTYGKIPAAPANTTKHGTVIRHSCDNPACCNPNHLVVGTQRDNIADRNNRGRNATYNISHKGVAHPGVRLTEVDVLAIRRSTETERQLANFYGVTRSCIQGVRNRTTWRHL
jgi:hypothetical protein